MNWIKENWFKLGALIIALIVALAFWQSLVIIPSKKIAEQKLEKEEQSRKEKLDEEDRQSSRDFCLILVEKSYLSRAKLNATSDDDFNTWKWNSTSSQEYVEDQRKSDKDECYKKYPTN